MTRWSPDDLRAATLRRQFPDPTGTGADDVLALVARLGPLQSQVPRAPFLTASSRLPGVAYATVRDLFASFRLVKTTSLRGTVHTTLASQHGCVDAVARHTRAGALRRALGLVRTTPDDVAAALEGFADRDWRTRPELVDHLRRWLAEHESPAAAERLTGTRDNLVWGHSGLLRRPPDDRWEKRTDVHHRRACALLPGQDRPDQDRPTVAVALAALVRRQIGAAGPLTRRDLASWSGAGLTLVDAAVRSLGDEVVRAPGPGGEEYLDLAEPPPPARTGPGVRLLPEFDALLLAYHPSHRTRFLSEDDLAAVWAKVNGQCAPVVLHEDRVVATWRTLPRGRRTDVEVTVLPGHRAPSEDLLGEAAQDAGRALDLAVGEVRLVP